MSSTASRWLEGVWYEGRTGALFLTPLAGLFALGTAARRFLFRRGWWRSYRARVPVVIIGNLSVGGTGKSPLVAALSTLLRSRGIKPGILTRGYGAAVRSPIRVTRDSQAAEVGDEPLMLATSTGVEVMVASDRAAGARSLESLGVDVILCDDGLQHYALDRDLEVVVVDARRGLGNGRLLPAGPLRESAQRLESVDWVVINGGEAGGKTFWQGRAGTVVMQLVPEAARGVANPLTWQSVGRWRGEAVHAVAGIGHPARFFDLLRAAGVEPIEHAFGDHHAFTAADLTFEDDRPILMTSKDAVKCRNFADARCWEIPVATRLLPDGARSLVEAIETLCLAEKKSESA
ncbi:MAG: tetraacyldisaccharide 4'-kinase [Gammaproteobacteria bacterium]|nr:tetraacyldisaccharide 4'-kinase [Gammaproteobacteria bacterium]